MTLATRCPACGTVFRVVQDQLRVSEGWVRCGRCSEPFNALEAMVEWPPVRTAAPAAPPAPSAPVAPEEPTAPAAPPAPVEPVAEAPAEAAAATSALEPAPVAEAPAADEPGLAGQAVAAAVVTPESAAEPPASDAATAHEPTAEAGISGTRDEAQAFSAESADVPPAEPAFIELPPGIEVVATDGALGLDAARPPDSPHVADVRIEPVLDADPPAEAAAPLAESPTLSPAATALETAAAPATEALHPAEAGAGVAPSALEPAPSFVVKADRAARWRRPGVRIALGLASLLAALGLAAQVTHAYRDRIAAVSPALRPWLQQACAAVGCRVGEYRQIDALSVESSGLVRVEGAPVYRLAVTLRNRAPLEVAAPAIDLALTDAQGQQIARRVLTMADLDLPLRSLKPGSELPIQAPLRIDGQVSGYTVEIFYP